MNIIDFYRGLIIVPPHGSYIRNRLKIMIIKTKKIKTIINKNLLLIQHKTGLGFIELGEPVKINLKKLNHLKRYHKITDDERKKWWPMYKTFYAYPIIKSKFFKIPLLIEYPTGPQITVKPSNIDIKRILIGMSGYQYQGMYPSNVKTDMMLEYYSQYLNSVEINYTFYRTPTSKFVNNLSKYNLLYSIKVNQSITHYKQLKNVKSLWKKFYKIFEPIHHQIICFLFQFNSRFVYNQKNFNKIKKLAKYLNKKHRYAFEFRDIEWFHNKKVDNLFRKYYLVLVITNLNNQSGWADDLITGFNPKLHQYNVTSDTIYFRMHGTIGQYTGNYNTRDFKDIFNLINDNPVKNALIYFNNTDSDDAWYDANYLFKKFNPINLY